MAGERRGYALVEPALLYLADADVRQILTTSAAIEICYEMLLTQARGEVVWSAPRLLGMQADSVPTRYLAKGCILSGAGIAGMRIIAKHPDRSVEGQGTKFILLSDLETGLWRGIMDEEFAHKVRTGAAAAVAARLLANPDASTLALVGAGPMARFTLTALAEIFPLTDVRITSRTPASRQALVVWAQESLGIAARAMTTVRETVEGADLVVTATSAEAPIVEDDWLAPGVFVYAMGDHQELTTAVYAGADRFFADDWEQCQVRADIQALLTAGVLTPERVDGSLWEVAAGLRPGRSGVRERIVVRSQGLVTQDIAIAWWVYRQARDHGVGIPL